MWCDFIILFPFTSPCEVGVADGVLDHFAEIGDVLILVVVLRPTAMELGVDAFHALVDVVAPPVRGPLTLICASFLNYVVRLHYFIPFRGV